MTLRPSPNASGPTTPPAPHAVFLGISHKMYLSPDQALDWARSVALLAARHDALRHKLAKLVVLPSFPVVQGLAGIFGGTDIAVGAQDLHYEDRGAFTGAVSGADLHQIGCRYVEIGHHERRSLFGDDERIVRLKVAAALRTKLTPILCVGEPTRMSLADAQACCLQQLETALGWLVDEHAPVPLVLAYEPAWAIGQAAAADVAHVRIMTQALRGWLAGRASLAGARVIYGGSAGPGTLTALGEDGADGLFLGRFVHNVSGLAAILDEVLTLCLSRATRAAPAIQGVGL